MILAYIVQIKTRKNQSNISQNGLKIHVLHVFLPPGGPPNRRLRRLLLLLFLLRLPHPYNINVSSIKGTVSSVKYQVYKYKSQVLGVKYQVYNFKYQVLVIKVLVPSLKVPAQGPNAINKLISC